MKVVDYIDAAWNILKNRYIARRNTIDHLGGANCLGDANTFMPDVWGYLLVKYNLGSVIDIGCGYGHTLKWFKDIGGCRIKGVEGWDKAINSSLIKLDLIKHDFTNGPLDYGSPFDLAWSSEFVEHVEEQYIKNFMPAFRLAKCAVITHGEPGQAGHHHVNCQDSDYWIKKFEEYGFKFNPIETRILRQTDRKHAGWGRRSLLFFERSSRI